jgi:hypothetical protein
LLAAFEHIRCLDKLKWWAEKTGESRNGLFFLSFLALYTQTIHATHPKIYEHGATICRLRMTSQLVGRRRMKREKTREEEENEGKGGEEAAG